MNEAIVRRHGVRDGLVGGRAGAPKSSSAGNPTCCRGPPRAARCAHLDRRPLFRPSGSPRAEGQLRTAGTGGICEGRDDEDEQERQRGGGRPSLAGLRARSGGRLSRVRCRGLVGQLRRRIFHAGEEPAGAGAGSHQSRGARGVCQIRDPIPSFEVCVLAVAPPASKAQVPNQMAGAPSAAAAGGRSRSRALPRAVESPVLIGRAGGLLMNDER